MEGEWLWEISKQLITVGFILDQDIFIFLTLLNYIKM